MLGIPLDHSNQVIKIETADKSSVSRHGDGRPRRHVMKRDVMQEIYGPKEL